MLLCRCVLLREQDYVLHVLHMYVAIALWMLLYIYIHILYILRNIRNNNIGVWVNRVRMMSLCLHSSIGEVQ